MEPITNELNEEGTRRIVTELDPEEIILFGSYAWGTPHKYGCVAKTGEGLVEVANIITA